MYIEERVLQAMRAADAACQKYQDRPIAQQRALVQGIFTAALQQVAVEAAEIAERRADEKGDGFTDARQVATAIRKRFGIEKEE